MSTPGVTKLPHFQVATIRQYHEKHKTTHTGADDVEQTVSQTRQVERGAKKLSYNRKAVIAVGTLLQPLL